MTKKPRSTVKYCHSYCKIANCYFKFLSHKMQCTLYVVNVNVHDPLSLISAYFRLLFYRLHVTAYFVRVVLLFLCFFFVA